MKGDSILTSLTVGRGIERGRDSLQKLLFLFMDSHTQNSFQPYLFPLLSLLPNFKERIWERIPWTFIIFYNKKIHFKMNHLSSHRKVEWKKRIERSRFWGSGFQKKWWDRECHIEFIPDTTLVIDPESNTEGMAVSKFIFSISVLVQKIYKFLFGTWKRDHEIENSFFHYCPLIPVHPYCYQRLLPPLSSSKFGQRLLKSVFLFMIGLDELRYTLPRKCDT